MSRSGYITIALLAVIVVIAFLFYLRVQQQNESDILQSSSAANALQPTDGSLYTDIDGNTVSLNQYIGTNVVAFSWASWCPSCGDQLKLMSKVAKNNPTVKILAFNRAEPKSTAISYLKTYGLEDTVDLIMDPKDYFFKSIEGYAMPEFVIFNINGDKIYHKRGNISESELSSILSELQIDYSQN